MKSKLAVWSFILSLVPIAITLLFTIVMSIGELQLPTLGNILTRFSYFFIFTFWLLILSVILGVFALIVIKRDKLEGKKYAITGIIISILSVIIALVGDSII